MPTLSLEGLPEVWLQGAPVKEWEKDKVYIFEFWATWCGPCLAAMPHMEQLHQAFKDNPRMQIIGVNVMDRKTPEVLKEFIKNRPAPLNYTMAVDVDGKKTREKWLEPLKVNGIPHAFAVKNGRLIWRGHPSQLSEKTMQAMLKPDFSAASLAAKGPDAGAREWQHYRETSQKVRELVEKDGKLGAQALLKQVQDSGKFPQDQVIQLKMIPFLVLAEQGKFEEAQSVLSDVSREYPDDYRVQIDIAGTLMEGKSVPAGKMDAALVERCLNRCIEISRKSNKEASLPWRMMAELRERQGNMKEALQDMEKALSLTSISRAWTKLQKLSGTTETFQSLMNQAVAEIKPEPLRKKQVLGPVQEDEQYTPLFSKLDWVNHPALTGLPSGKTVFISFWRWSPAQGGLWSDGAPGRALDVVLKKYGLLDHPGVKAVVLDVIPSDKKQVKEYLDSPEGWTAYPVGVPSDDSVAELFESLKLDSFPAAAVIRDGTLLWAGEIKRMPEWVAETARRDSFDKNQFAEEEAKRKARQQAMQAVIKKSFELRRDKKFDEYKKLIEENAERFADDGWFASTVAEIQAGEAWKEKDYQKVADIIDQVLKRFPKEDSLASYLLKILNGSDEMRGYNYQAARHALQIMKDSNTRDDGGYNAACYEVMMNMAVKKKDYAQAKKDALNALRELPLMHQYAAMKKKQAEA
ncbi:thioredoxin-like domain-containing protein [Akkermansia muciniphila]|uniref:thioredoxin-like domain-containing protein n=1 Tax=Akkermansia muciniphila TaxID=239935 RepID=UPI001BFF79BA|nr:thioredoxin-like domain-containing protein [Akkermansia muciniphila]MBT8777311.1 redoxin domain-containing protein [Akkermansia muciniphila]